MLALPCQYQIKLLSVFRFWNWVVSACVAHETSGEVDVCDYWGCSVGGASHAGCTTNGMCAKDNNYV